MRLTAAGIAVTALAALAPAAAAAEPREIAVVKGYPAAPVLAGPRVVWVEGEGSCGSADSSGRCVQRIVGWRDGRRATLHRYASYGHGLYSPRLVTGISGSSRRIAFERTVFEDFRGPYPVRRDAFWLRPGGAAKRLSCCKSADSDGVDVDGTRVAVDDHDGRRSLVRLFDLRGPAARTLRTFRARRFISDYRLARTRLAVEWVSGDFQVDVYDWRSAKRLLTFQRTAIGGGFDLQGDGKLALSHLRGFEQRDGRTPPPGFGWLSPAGRFHSLRGMVQPGNGAVWIRRNLVAIQPSDEERSSVKRDIVVVDLAGRVRYRQAFDGRLIDFDGSCLLMLSSAEQAGPQRLSLDRVGPHRRGSAC